MKMLKILVLCSGIAITLGGCAWGVGNDFKFTEMPNTTAGQELLDLQKAKEAGLVTDEEFMKVKAKIMKRYISDKSKKDKDSCD